MWLYRQAMYRCSVSFGRNGLARELPLEVANSGPFLEFESGIMRIILYLSQYEQKSCGLKMILPWHKKVVA